MGIVYAATQTCSLVTLWEHSERTQMTPSAAQINIRRAQQKQTMHTYVMQTYSTTKSGEQHSVQVDD